MTELLVDREMDKEKEGVYFITPENLSQLRFVKTGSFSKATIRNCNVSYLTGYNLQSLFNSLQKDGYATIIIDQPVLVLQDYDENTIKANAELAGFKNIRSKEVKAYCQGLESEVETISITLIK